MSRAKRRIHKKRKEYKKEIAKERIGILFDLAKQCALSGEVELSNRYVKLGRDISMRHNVRIPGKLKGKFCKYCYSYLAPARTTRVRINSKKHRVEVFCNNCERKMYYPYTREIKQKRRERIKAKFLNSG